MAEMKPLDLTQLALHKLFDYRDGVLFWRVKVRGVNPGDVAGGKMPVDGYWRVKIGGKPYKRSRLVWMYLNDEDTYPMMLDHINRNRTDDRVENLRKVTHAENQENRVFASSGYGYVYESDGRWRARLGMRHDRKTIGVFDTKEEAAEAIDNWRAANV